MKTKLKNAAYALMTAMSFVLIILIVLFSNRSGQVDIKTGDVSTVDIYAPRTIIDSVTTAAARKAASDGVEDVYVTNDSKRTAAIDKVTDFFSAAAALRSEDDGSGTAAKALKLKATAKAKLSDKSCEAAINATDAEFARMRTVADIIGELMQSGVSDAAKAVEDCAAKADKLNITKAEKSALSDLASAVITENTELDEAETKRRKEAAALSVADIEYKKNQIILRKGEIASDAQLAMLRELGLLKGTNPLSATYTVGIFLLTVICYIIILAYFAFCGRGQRGAAAVTAVMGVISVLISFYGSRYVPEKYVPFLPAGLFVSVVTTFSVPQTAVIFNVLISIFCGVALSGDWGYSVCLILAGSLSAYCFGKVRRRSHLIPAAFASALGYGVVFCAMSLIQSSGAGTAFSMLLRGFAGGMISGIITIGTLPFWEWIFNATTPMKLTELANPENKLLKRLLVEAPGTYHHSLTVANIAEIAAREIGADSLLARVGAYYHDIGKIRRPLYFKENQYNKNEHDELSPEESSAIIKGHVMDGVETAQRYRLPQSICDIIAQHHGTTTTGYFLIRAREKNPNVDEADFAYPGPKPQTREAAIVMLADSCEAAVRSLSDKSEEKISAMVRKIASDRINSGQFMQCDLTFAELEKVIETIIKTLGGYFHERIKYE